MLTRIWEIIIELRFDLGIKGLKFASTMNLESVPRFADIYIEWNNSIVGSGVVVVEKPFLAYGETCKIPTVILL